MTKYIRIAYQVIILFLFSHLGSFIVQILSIDFPGSIVGLLLLFICLYLKIIPVNLINEGAGFLLGLLALFFVPTTVGIMNYPQLFSIEGFLILFSIIASTIFTLMITGKICSFIESKESKENAIL